MCFCVSFVLFIIYLFTYLLTYFAVYCISWICGYGELIKFGKFSAVHYFLQILFWLPFSYFFWDSNYVYARPLDTIIKVTYWETLFWDSQYSLREFLLYFVCSWFSAVSMAKFSEVAFLLLLLVVPRMWKLLFIEIWYFSILI